LKSLYEEGQGNPADYSNILGQLRSDENAIADTKASLVQARLELQQLLNLDHEVSIVYAQEMEPPASLGLTAETVYQTALEKMPLIDAGQYRVQAAKENIAVSKSLYVPSIDLFAQVNSNFSSLANLFNDAGSEVVATGGFVTIDGIDYSVFRNEQQFTQESIPFLDQLNNNLNTVIGVAVEVPIFNGFRAKQNVRLRTLEFEDSKMELENAKNNLEIEVKTAFALMNSAYENYLSFEQQVTAYEASYHIHEVRFNNGVSNYVEFILSKNNLDQARINLRNSYYEYLMRKRIIAFYMGAS
jgi:outer membrane protein